MPWQVYPDKIIRYQRGVEKAEDRLECAKEAVQQATGKEREEKRRF